MLYSTISSSTLDCNTCNSIPPSLPYHPSFHSLYETLTCVQKAICEHLFVYVCASVEMFNACPRGCNKKDEDEEKNESDGG